MKNDDNQYLVNVAFIMCVVPVCKKRLVTKYICVVVLRKQFLEHITFPCNLSQLCLPSSIN